MMAINIFKLLALIVICGMIGAVAVTVLLKVVVYGIYVAVGAFTLFAAILAAAAARILRIGRPRE